MLNQSVAQFLKETEGRVEVQILLDTLRINRKACSKVRGDEGDFKENYKAIEREIKEKHVGFSITAEQICECVI